MFSTTPLKFVIQKMFRQVGYEVHRIRFGEAEQLKTLFDLTLVEQVLDIGANVGQYAHGIRNAGYRGEIISFEPLSDVHARLTREAAGDPGWHVAPRTAIGSEPGEMTINISQDLASSSLLPMTDLHVETVPVSHYVGSETVEVMRLDDCTEFDRSKRTFLKMDTQGYEAQVLDGAPHTLASVLGVQLEMSLAPCYDGQTLFSGLLNRLESAGFVLWGLHQGTGHPTNGRLLQADGIFVRREAVER